MLSTKKKNFKLSTREKPQSRRQQRVSRVIQECLMDYFIKRGSLSMQSLDQYPLSITKVNISPDLRVANCFFLPFNTSLSTEQIGALLEEAKYEIRAHITKKLQLKYSPELRFYHDTPMENAIKIYNTNKSD